MTSPLGIPVQTGSYLRRSHYGREQILSTRTLSTLESPVGTGHRTGLFPLLVIVFLVPIAIVPDPRALIGVGYAAALTLSFVYFGLNLRKIGG